MDTMYSLKDADFAAIADFVIELWRAQGLSLSQEEAGHIQNAIASPNPMPFPDSFRKRLVEEIKAHQPTDSRPSWLDRINRTFNPPERKLLDLEHRRHDMRCSDSFRQVLLLVSPLVSLEHLVDLAFMTDGFLMANERLFSHWPLPRDIGEAERYYQRLLTLPHRYSVQAGQDRRGSDQPFKAQILFAGFLIQEHAAETPLGQFQRKCLEECPEWLLGAVPEDPNPAPMINPLTDENTVDISLLLELMQRTQESRNSSFATNSRPAFWLGTVVRPDLQALLMARGCEEVRLKVGKQVEYQQKQAEIRDVLNVQVLLTDQELSASDQSELNTLLAELSGELKVRAPSYSAGLNPPATPANIAALNRHLAPLRLPDDVAALYLWHNGESEHGNDLFGFPGFLPLSSALYTYGECIRHFGEHGWSKVWWPIASSGRSYRLIALTAGNTARPSEVYTHEVEEGSLCVGFSSVQIMVKAWLAALRQEIVVWNSNYTAWDTDQDRWEALLHSLNPEDILQAGYDIFDSGTWPAEWREFRIGEA